MNLVRRTIPLPPPRLFVLFLQPLVWRWLTRSFVLGKLLNDAGKVMVAMAHVLIVGILGDRAVGLRSRLPVGFNLPNACTGSREPL